MSSTFRRLVSVALVLGTAACADSPTAPVTRAPAGGIDLSLIGMLVRGSGDTTVTTFTVDPTSSTTFQVGSGHVVYFPRNSICDLASSYGPSEWDKPCRPATSRINITARTWVDGNGQPRVDFSPAMRFTTSTNSYGNSYGNSSGNSYGDVVMIGLAIDRLTAATAADRLKILYCPTSDASCVDESLTDASLRTSVNVVSGYVTRRIKHFSGYNVSSGRDPMDMLSLSRGASPSSTEPTESSRTGHLMSSGRSE